MSCPICGEPAPFMPHCDLIACNLGHCCGCGAVVGVRNGVVTATPFRESNAIIEGENR